MELYKETYMGQEIVVFESKKGLKVVAGDQEYWYNLNGLEWTFGWSSRHEAIMALVRQAKGGIAMGETGSTGPNCRNGIKVLCGCDEASEELINIWWDRNEVELICRGCGEKWKVRLDRYAEWLRGMGGAEVEDVVNTGWYVYCEGE